MTLFTITDGDVDKNDIALFKVASPFLARVNLKPISLLADSNFYPHGKLF
jgi:hypothetical protein